MKVFIGSDPHAPIALNVASFSVWRRASKPVEIIPLVLDQLPLARRGLTEFTFTRFLVPYLCQFQGWAVWMDSDILCNVDIHQLMNYADESVPLSVVDTKEPFERTAVMLFNCAHPDNAVLTPDHIERAKNLHGLDWVKKEAGVLPREWNWCIGYDEDMAIDNGDTPSPKAMLHFTKGIPVWPETKDCEYAEVWHAERRAMCGVVPNWSDLMGESRHEVT